MKVRSINQRTVQKARLLEIGKIDGIPAKNAVVIGNRALARLLDVTEQTVINWRNDGIIEGKELAPNIWRYRISEVLEGLRSKIF